MESYWIWNYGDYEIYHTNLVSTRRQEHGVDVPAFWRNCDIERNVKFVCDAEIPNDGYICLTVNGKGYFNIDGKRKPSSIPVLIARGKHRLEICVVNLTTLPAAFIESDVCRTDGKWYTMDDRDGHIPVGWDTKYNRADMTPDTFLFSYDRIQPVTREDFAGGILFDFGKETFGYLLLQNAAKEEKIHVSYGESREEALDIRHAIVWEDVTGKESYRLTQRAFRYIYVTGGSTVTVEADYEYLPLPYRGSFRCSNETVNKIWELSAYTLHLNTREVLLDGIKRDRWLWSGDAYQCYKFANYLFFDKDIVRRSILGLRGSDPVLEHINTITDYSMYWVISLWEYYQNFRDLDFIRFIYPRAVSLMDFIGTRENAQGLLIAKYKDWVFLDWSDMDKTGAVCAEQMLYIQANKAMALLGELLDMPCSRYREKAEQLTDTVNSLYWDDDQGAFIDSYESGKRNVTRHANIFAILFDIATEEQTGAIVKNVLENDRITKITTPYFEGFELDAMGKVGRLDYIEDMLLSYWKGMLDLGATSLWEEFDPATTGLAHYAMYEEPYGKSLCHAWSSGPIYLLGRYYLGVYPTRAGFETFEVAPKLGGFEYVEGTVPILDGEVQVSLSKKGLKVIASRPGGILIWKGVRYSLAPNDPVVLELHRNEW